MATTREQTFTLGERCSVTAGQGVVAFVGSTAFAAGKWVGIKLDSPVGKNDGSVAGKRYFDCDPSCGVFVRPSQVRIDQEGPPQPISRPPSSIRSSTATPVRPVALSRASSSTSERRPPSTSNALPTREIFKIPATPRTVGPKAPVPSRTASTIPATPRTLSNVSRTTGSSTMARQTSNSSATSAISARSSVYSRPQSSQSGAALLSPRIIKSHASTPEQEDTATFRNQLSTAQDNNELASFDLLEEPLPPENYASPTPVRSDAEDPFSLKSKEPRRQEQTVALRTHEEALLRIKMLETRQVESRDRLRELDRLKEEAETWASARPKLQAKLLELNSEVKELRKTTKELESERDVANSRYNDLADEVEMATLDKEVAEEKFEAAEISLEAIKEKYAGLEVELDVLRAETARMNGDVASALPTDADRSSLAFIQLEKQNERLKEALVRLRDLTAESDAEHRRKMTDLERELELTSDLQNEFDEMASRAETAEAQVEDLKLQLDDALGAEDLLEQLTERNLTLSEKLEDMRSTIEDLEALRELNDELEESHVENEKQLMAEIEINVSQLSESRKRVDLLEESMVDYENTIAQFRDLVANLQGDLDHMREQQNMAQSDVQQLSSQSQAMLSLNMKLQKSVHSSQVKVVDLELRRLDARESRERLDITKYYLPQIFYEGDSNAVDALLFFDRLAYKSELLANGLSQKHNISDALNSVVPDGLVAICEARAKLARFSILTRRFAANLRRCSTDVFLRMGGIYRELLAIEKRLDDFVQQLRNDELREIECSRDIDKFIAQAAHVAEMHLGESGLDFGEMQLGQAVTLDYDLDTFMVGIGFSKQCIALLIRDVDIRKAIADVDLSTIIFEPFQQYIDQARSAQNSSRKVLRRMEEIVSKESCLLPASTEMLGEIGRTVHLLGNAAARIADLTLRYATELRSSKEAIQVESILGIVQEATADLGFHSSNVLAAIDTEIALVVTRLFTSLTAVFEISNVQTIYYLSPWSERVAQIASSRAINLEAEQKATKLNEELRDMVRLMRSKDQALQESSVKIELVEKRMEAAKKQAEAVQELEVELSKARKQEKTYEGVVDSLRKDLDIFEQEIQKLKQAAPTTVTSPGRMRQQPSEPNTESLPFTGSLETAHLLSYVEGLRGSVRHLRNENTFLKSQATLAELNDLPALTLPTPPVAEDALRSLTEQTKSLWRDTVNLAANVKVVDLSHIDGSVKWLKNEHKPEVQQEKQRAALNRLVNRLSRVKGGLGQLENLPRVVSINT